MKRISNKLAWLVSAGCFFGLTAGAQYTPTLTYDDEVTRGVYFGTGNSNGSFTIDRNADIGLELGLRAKVRYENTYNSLGNGQYFMPAGGYPGAEDLAIWNFEFSVDTDYLNNNSKALSDYRFELKVDKDATLGTDMVDITGYASSQMDTNFDQNPYRFWYDPAGGQDSQNYGFDALNFKWFWPWIDLDFDPTAQGSYIISLAAYEKSWSGDGALLGMTEIEVLVGDLYVTPVPEPATIGILSFGGLGLLLVIRRRIQSRKA